MRRIYANCLTYALLCTVAFIAPSAQGQFKAKEIAGIYDGTLQCTSAKHETHFKLSLTATGDYKLTGILTFDAQDDSGTRPVTYSLTGTNAGASFSVFPLKWETPAPPRHMVTTRSGAYNVNTWFGLNGLYDSSGTISGIELGIVINPACTFSAKRSQPTSATSIPAAAQKEGTTASLQPGMAYYYCAGLSRTNIYFSGTFTGPERIDINIVRDDFARFLNEKYSLKETESSAGCGLGRRSMEESNSAKAEQANRNSQRKPIETGWKPKSLPPVVSRH